MGDVYAATDPLLDRKVAIKVLSAAWAEDPAARERFLREARAAARLSHPHVIPIYEIDERDGRWYIVMELMPAGNLQDRMRKQGPFDWQEATRCIADACRGLVAAHAMGMIHREIKPANLMLSADGTVKLADFGLAKEGGPADQLTAPGTIVGTPAYMRPEQWRAETLTDLTDTYSLGATYYDLLTGNAPHDGREPLQVMYACCTQPPPDPRQVRPEIPAACVAIVSRAMAREPADRFPSAAAMLTALEKIAGSDSLILDVTRTQTVPLSRTRAMPRLSRRQWIAAGAGGAAALLAGGAYLLSGRSPSASNPSLGACQSPNTMTVSSISPAPAAQPITKDWTPLFNGRNVDGWWSYDNRKGGNSRVENKTPSPCCPA